MPRKRLTSQRKMAGILLAMFSGWVSSFSSQRWGIWTLGVCAAGVVAGITIAIAGRSRIPHTRLCALQWNRGDRFGAVMLFFNVTEPRYSAKRIARNKAALEAAQVGMPKECWFNSFAKRDDQ